MSKLRIVTFAILLLLVVAVGCSSSDQGAIDKAVNATLASAQPATSTATPEAAKEHGGSSIERVDIEARDEFGRTPLHTAALRNSLDVARELINLGADIEAKEDEGGTPLHMAAANNSLDVARLLIDLGADIEARIELGATPLHLAALRNSLDVARELVDLGADIEAM